MKKLERDINYLQRGCGFGDDEPESKRRKSGRVSSIEPIQVNDCKTGYALVVKEKNSMSSYLLLCSTDLYNETMKSNIGYNKYTFVYPPVYNDNRVDSNNDLPDDLVKSGMLEYKLPGDIQDFVENQYKNNPDTKKQKNIPNLYKYITNPEQNDWIGPIQPPPPSQIPTQTIVQIDIDNPKIIKFLELLSLYDKKKDFIEGSTSKSPEKKPDTGSIGGEKTKPLKDTKTCKNKKNQEMILDEFITNIQNDLGISQTNKKNIMRQIETGLGIKFVYPKELMVNLFPIKTSDGFVVYRIQEFYPKFIRYLVTVCSFPEDIDRGFGKLKEFSNSYKNNSSKIDVLNKLDIYYSRYENNNTLAWVDSTPGEHRYQELIGYLAQINDAGNLYTYTGPPQKMDDAPEKTDMTILTKNIIDLNINYPVNIKVNNGPETLLEYLITPAMNDTYEFDIKQFYTLKCDKFDPNYIRSRTGNLRKINTPQTWETLADLFKGDKKINIGDTDFNELDLCIKSNKTSMDMLKSIYVKGLMDDDVNLHKFNLVSIFNDINAARFAASINKKGLVIYASSVPFHQGIAPLKTQMQIVLRQKYLDKLELPAQQPESSSLDIEEEEEGEEDVCSMEFGKKRLKQNLKQNLKQLNKDISFLLKCC